MQRKGCLSPRRRPPCDVQVGHMMEILPLVSLLIGLVKVPSTAGARLHTMRGICISAVAVLPAQAVGQHQKHKLA
jgi:hypothetical protein